MKDRELKKRQHSAGWSPPVQPQAATPDTAPADAGPVAFSRHTFANISLYPNKTQEQASDGMAMSLDRVPEEIGTLAGSGIALDPPVRNRLEQGLGSDLSGIRVHTGAEANRLADAVNAEAFTTGSHIFFRSGAYVPRSPHGLELLAHEVVHTVQQSTGPTMGATIGSGVTLSSPADPLERQATRISEQLVSGKVMDTPAFLGHNPPSSSGAISIQRKEADKKPTSGTLQGAGDEAEANALKAPLQVDTVSVQTDQKRVGELIADIKSQKTKLEKAEKDDPDLETRFAPLATNTATEAKLSIFNDKLDVSKVDTTAFAAQYRLAYSEYHRLTAEASALMAKSKSDGKDPLDAAGAAMGNSPAMKIGDKQGGLERFRSARRNLNTAALRMEPKLTGARAAADLLQGAVYEAKAAAAAATGQDAATKLKDVRDEIEKVAQGVGTVVKLCTAVAGLAGGGGAVNALAPKDTGGSVDIDPSRSGLATGGTVLTPEDPSKLELIKAMGEDGSKLLGGEGGPDKLAESLVKAIGEYANKDKIANLQQTIVKAEAEETTFKAAGAAQKMGGYQAQMQAAGQELSLEIQAFASAKQEMIEASQTLIAELNKEGPKGQDQAKGVLFLTDADRFLAQVQDAIAVGRNQQSNLRDAARDRKALRGTNAALEGGKDSLTQYYYRVIKITVPGRIYGTNDLYKLQRVDVTFQNTDLNPDYNNVVQGGAGSVEGVGSADDSVASKIEVLTKAQEQVKAFQTKIQTALGVGAPGLNP
jgi:hypothetical protein